MKSWRLLPSLVIFCATAFVYAGEVYVCEKNGRKEFSQLPCGENAVVLQMEGEPNSIKVSIPLLPKEVSAVCQLAIQAKDKSIERRKATDRTNAQIDQMNAQNYRYRNYNYNRRYNYGYNNSYGYYPKNRKHDNPETYFLSKIENLSMIAKKSPEIYRMLKGLVYSVSYDGYTEESPVYEAERAAALVHCEDNLNTQMEYMRRNN